MSILTPTIKIFCDEVLKTGKGFSEIRRLLAEQGWQPADIATVLEEYVKNADIEERAEAKLINGGSSATATSEKADIHASGAVTTMGENFRQKVSATSIAEKSPAPIPASATPSTPTPETAQPAYFNASYNLNTPVPGMPEYAAYIAQHPPKPAAAPAATLAASTLVSEQLPATNRADIGLPLTKVEEKSPAPIPASATPSTAPSTPSPSPALTEAPDTTITEDKPSWFSDLIYKIKKHWHWGFVVGIVGGLIVIAGLSTYAYAAWVNPFVFSDAKETLFEGIRNRLNTKGLAAAGVANITFEDHTAKDTISSLDIPFELIVDHKGPSTFIGDLTTPHATDNISLTIKDASLSLPPTVYPLGTLNASAHVRVLNDQKKAYFFVDTIPLPLKLALGSFDITKQWFMLDTTQSTTTFAGANIIQGIPTTQDIASQLAIAEAANEAVRIDIAERIAGGGLKILFTFNLAQYEEALTRTHPGLGKNITSTPTGQQMSAAFDRLRDITGTAIIGNDKKLKSLILNSSANDARSRLASTLTIAFTPDEQVTVQAPSDARDLQAFIAEQQKKAAAAALAAKKSVKKKK